MNIVFNYGLPEEKSIGYIYTADGTKLRKYTNGSGTENTYTDYIGAYVYEESDLQFIQTSEGRLVPDGSGGYNYEYALKDHLGNTRIMFDETGQVLQDQSYYPFGMSMGEALTFHMPSSLPDNKYLYNGKELQDDFELGWYDYGARFYDPALGRWHVIDPMCEIARRWNPYQYAYNNPIRFIDPDGMMVDDFYFNKEGKLDKYVENDEPDRVFVATGETTTDESAENPMPEPVYEQVEMSSEEVEQKMDENGYAKVVEEEIVEYTEMTTYYTDADGGNRETSKNRTTDKVTPTDHMYVKKGAEGNFDVSTMHLATKNRKHGGAYMIEQNVRKENIHMALKIQAEA